MCQCASMANKMDLFSQLLHDIMLLLEASPEDIDESHHYLYLGIDMIYDSNKLLKFFLVSVI